jgi:hypothetical protein
MIQEIIKYVFRFLLLIALQVLLFKNIYLGRFIILLPYILFIICLPFSTNRILVLFASLALGFALDMFYDNEGLFAAACLFTGFLRYFVLMLLAPRDGYTDAAIPSSQTMGWASFLIYSSTLVLAHHLLFFYLEIFRFTQFFTTMLTVFASTFFSLLLILVMQFLFYRNQSSAY